MAVSKTNINQLNFLRSFHTALIGNSIIISLIVYSNILLPSPAAKGKQKQHQFIDLYRVEKCSIFPKTITFKPERLSTLGYVGFEKHHWHVVRRLDRHLLRILEYFLSRFSAL